MEVFKYGEILGEVVKRYPNGEVLVNYDGTELIMNDEDNELSCGVQENKFEFGGSLAGKKILLGKEIELKMPNGEVRKGQFAIVELTDIIASHNEKTFESSEGYPVDSGGDNINDRNYKDDPNAQAKVREFAANLEPDRLITTSRTPSGTPIITENGIVVSGNNRTMSIKLAVTEFPKKYREYLNFLSEEIESFGFSKMEMVRDNSYSPNNSGIKSVTFRTKGGTTKTFEKPLLVRIDYDIPALNTLELSKYNKDTKKSERPIDKAVKLSKQLAANPKCEELISKIVGDYETFTEFYQRGDQKALIKALIDCDILTTQEMPLYFANASFTTAGQELVENVLAGIVLNKESLIITDQIARKFRSIIITSLPVLVTNSTLGEYSLIEKLNEAISLENKIISSKLAFKDWINQLDLFERTNDREALILNRLLNSGRNRFKGAFEKYNESAADNSGNASLFGDVVSKDEIFNVHISSKIDPEELKMIEASSDTALTEKIVTPKEKPMQETKTSSAGINLLINGNYFKENPENILADQKSGVSRWQKPITIYEGGIENLEKINAPINFVSSNIGSAPTVSVMNTPVTKKTDSDTETLVNLEAAVEKSKTDIHEKIKRKKARKDDQVTVSDELQTLSLKEVYEMPGMNDNISQDDLRVYLWYQNRVGKTVTNSEWYELAGSTMSEVLSDDNIEPWVRSGKLFYYAGVLWPKYIYLSGDVYEKYSRLVVSGTSEDAQLEAALIKEKYGEDVYINQLNELQKVFKRKYDERLKLSGGNAEKGLKLLPGSDFSRSFYINSFEDELPFEIKKITAQSNSRFGQPDWFHQEAFDRKNVTLFEQFNLRDAFCYWLVSDKTVQVKQGVSASEIIQVYIQHKPFRAERAVKGSDGEYHGEQLEIYKRERAAYERLQAKTKSEGDRLFLDFVSTRLKPEDKTRLEDLWNAKYNNNVPINTSLIPVAFQMNKFCNGQLLVIKPEKREAVAFTLANGSGLLAYDVGVGKTPSAIFTISAFIDSGFCKRPLVVVPNQTYKQWINEFRNFAGHIRINELYNLNDSLVEELQDTNGNTMKLAEGSVTIITYQGLMNLGYSEEVANSIQGELTDILAQDFTGLSDNQARKQSEKTASSVEKLLGKALAKTKINLDELGIDYLCMDEAHAAKKVFTFVAGQPEEKTSTLGSAKDKSRAVVDYKIQSGTPSYIGVKAFTMCNYIQKRFKGNTQLLTATPFTNSPLEIYSMLAMISYNTLVQRGLYKLKDFFDLFIEVSYEIVINAKMQPERKQVILGFNNILVLQQLVRQFINYKTGEDAGVQRPAKWVLPYRNQVVNGTLMPLPDDKIVDSIIPMSDIQKEYMDLIYQYAEGTIDRSSLENAVKYNVSAETTDDEASDTDAIELDDEDMDNDEKAGVRLLLAMNHARNLVLSPYLFAGGNPTYEQFIETSYKLKYTIECIRSIKAHHEKTNTPMSGIVIYVERGVEYFDLIRQYLIKNVGFAENEVGILSAKQKLPVPPRIKEEQKKEYVKNLFLGERFNEESGLVEKIPDSERVKVLIGSATIREGINLQKYSSTLFNCFLSWNPTDIQQLEGRIYRQQNAFANVRIVNPLLVDSIDVFMFQKLEEKTSRINSIWETDGHTNALKIEDFNPNDLKFALIKDPYKLARKIILEETEKYDEEVADIRNKIERNETAIRKNTSVESERKNIQHEIEKYRPKEANKPFESQVAIMAQVYSKGLDDEGLPFSTGWRDDPKVTYSKTGLTKPYRPWNWDSFLKDFKFISRFTKTFLIPNGLRIEQLAEMNKDLEEQIKSVEKKKENALSDEAIKLKAEEFIAERERLNIREKTLPDVISEFRRLNWLLDDVKLPQVKKVIDLPCPPVDESGIARIDPEGLQLLDECISRQSTTKKMHTIESVVDGKTIYEYTADRKKLQDKIIDDMTANAVCIERQKPIAILMGGAPGSGKTTFLKKNAPYMTSEYIWKIDADEVRAKLPEYEGWNAAITHEETQDIVKRLLDEYDQPCRHDVLYDGTMTNVKKYNPVIKRLKKLGYEVYMAFMDIPKEESIKRAMKRYQHNSGGSKHGRYVPMSVIDDFFRTGDEAFNQLKKEVTGFVKVDSLTGQIVDKGGKEIPSDRPYSDLFTRTTDMATQDQEKKQPEVTLEDLKASFEGGKQLLQYLSGSEKENTQAWLDGLELAIKYYA